MTAIMSSPARSPYMAFAIVFFLVWSIWYLDIPSTRTAVQQQFGFNGGGGDASQVQEGKGAEGGQSNVPTGESGTAVPDRPLILYAYSETESARTNLEFFIKHGLHAAADFIFIINGESDAMNLIPEAKNIRYIQRPNDCYDLGAYAEVLTGNELYKNYKRFIMLNASIRGPFLPYWAENCWSDMYLRRVTDKVKLVGMTGNCWPSFHVQSMIWATDRVGIELLLFPPKKLTAKPVKAATKGDNLKGSALDKSESEPALPPGINNCFHSWSTAVRAEIGASALMKAAGYELDVMMSSYHKSDNYEAQCDGSSNGDVLWNGKYEGTNVHPYETIFQKSNRDIDPLSLRKLTEWTDGRGYSSYEFCKA